MPVACFSKKKPPTFVGGFVFMLHTFLGRPSIVLPSAGVRWTPAGRKKPRPFGRGFVFALPIFPGSHPPSIVGVHELNFCVRDGNRWTLMTINTNSYGWVLPIFYNQSSVELRLLGDPYRIRTDVNGVRGRCLNHLTNGPLVQLQGLEPGTH